MPILTGDIKLLKAAVMTDTSDGGGQMTGTQVIDGQSNNLFPDTSEIDRALGRVNLRKVFGVAQTSTTDMLLGAHAIITDAPNDPLVNCTLMASSAWSDTRATAKELIERYVVKGPRFNCRLLDTTYAGSSTIRLYQLVGSTDFPAAGDAIVLRNPNGVEQYVRITRTTTSNQTFSVIENGGVVQFQATLVTCTIGQALAYDFLGAPMARAIANETTLYASVFSTVASIGARFYGIKTLGDPASIGNVTAQIDGGIFSALIPAATVETPLTDQNPYPPRQGTVPTSQSAATLPNVNGAIAPGTIIKAPTAIEQGTVSLNHGGTIFTDSAGILRQGTTNVGTVEYANGTITFSPSSPSYANAGNVLTYKPASSAGAPAFSNDQTVTLGNQGLAWTYALNPLPAVSTVTVSYMAQGRWYQLTDDGAGKLAGIDTSYGVGTVNYSTGSIAVTLGALPDVNSSILVDWGNGSAATKITAGLPAKLGTKVPLPAKARASGITVTWSRNATTYTATTSTAGVLSGNATGQAWGGELWIEPNVFPDGAFTIDAEIAATNSSASTSPGTGQIQLTNTPVVRGSVKLDLFILGTPTDFVAINNPILVRDKDGKLFADMTQRSVAGFDGYSEGVEIGTINYTTGLITWAASVSVSLWKKVVETSPATAGFPAMVFNKYVQQSTSISLSLLNVNDYAYGTPGPNTTTFTPTTWQMDVGTTVFNRTRTSDVLFTIGSDWYSGQVGAIRKGWDLMAGAPSVGSAGTINNGGLVTITSLPSNNTNGVIWYNIAHDSSGDEVGRGAFRTATAPLKTGVLQLLLGANIANGDEPGNLSGGGFTGTVDYIRGIVRWTRSQTKVADIRYNAVFLQYLPLNASLLGLETARLPLDGRVPIYQSGDIVVVHNTQTYTLPNPLTKNNAYNLGRVRIAAVKVKTATGATVDTALYTTDLDAGTITFPLASDLTGLSQPFTVEHRIEDVMLVSEADISGKLTFTRGLTHNFPENTSFVSSALVIGDVQARAFNGFEQSTWTSVWSDTRSGSAPTANFNEAQNPIEVTNRGAITERWVIIFTNSTAFRVIGETVGEIATGNTSTLCAPTNPATGEPYFQIPAAGWGSGWATGNVYRFNTSACGAPFWVVRTVLQGPASLLSDQFTLAFRGDVDRP